MDVPLGTVLGDRMTRFVEFRIGFNEAKAQSVGEAGKAASARDRLAGLLRVRERFLGRSTSVP